MVQLPPDFTEVHAQAMTRYLRGTEHLTRSEWATLRTESLPHDFYLTRLYNVTSRQWRHVAIMRAAMWNVLDGEPTLTTWEDVWTVLPGIAQVDPVGKAWVIVLYEQWKERVLQRQREGERT
jgi:hypothetical protein